MVSPFDFAGRLWQEIFRQVVTSIGSSTSADLLTHLLLPLEERNKSCGYLEPLVDPHILVPCLHVPCCDVKQDVEVEVFAKIRRLWNYRVLGCSFDAKTY